MQTETMTAEQAIAESIQTTGTVHLESASKETIMDLLIECEDHTDNAGAEDFWGTTGEGSDWRVTVPAADFARAIAGGKTDSANPPGVEGYCRACGWPVAIEGWTLTGAAEAPREGAKVARCTDTSCGC